jgi:hypothetical protein
MSLITLNHFDFSELFYLATEPGYHIKSNGHTKLDINRENVCSVTTAKYGPNTLKREGPDGLDYVFLPVRISMVNGEIFEVRESRESVLCMIKALGDHGKTGRAPNRGYTIDPENSELIPRGR